MPATASPGRWAIRSMSCAAARSGAPGCSRASRSTPSSPCAATSRAGPGGRRRRCPTPVFARDRMVCAYAPALPRRRADARAHRADPRGGQDSWMNCITRAARATATRATAFPRKPGCRCCTCPTCQPARGHDPARLAHPRRPDGLSVSPACRAAAGCTPERRRASRARAPNAARRRTRAAWSWPARDTARRSHWAASNDGHAPRPLNSSSLVPTGRLRCSSITRAVTTQVLVQVRRSSTCNAEAPLCWSGTGAPSWAT